jgi:Na+/H+-dicarboxylate symporter
VADIARMLVAPNLLEQAAQNQLLPLIVFSIFFAVALTTLGERGLRVVEFLDGVNEAMMRIVGWIMYFAPVGIFALVAARLGEAGGGAGFIAEVRGVALYVVTVSTGLAIHFVVLLAILFLFARRGVAFVASMLRALMTALGTSSSAATLPVTMECARESGIDERAVRLVIPVGCTVNMDGTALYEAVAAMFIAQAYGIEMSVGQQAVVFVTATLAAVGAAGVPAGGLVTLVIVLNAVKLPLEGIGLILAVDWFVNRLRAAVNVWGDAVGAAILDRLLKSDRAGA